MARLRQLLQQRRQGNNDVRGMVADANIQGQATRIYAAMQVEADFEDSLEATIRRNSTPESLPVFTIADTNEFRTNTPTWIGVSKHSTTGSNPIRATHFLPPLRGGVLRFNRDLALDARDAGLTILAGPAE